MKPKNTRNSDLLTLCEDKVLKIQANKDALFNADGNINVTASSNVLGQTIPFAGDYGISKNPESFTTHNYRAYFADKQRGSVLRLSMDGLTVISDAGMSDWFKDNLKPSTTILGTYDNNKKQYNLTLKGSSNYTVSYKENIKGWTSFKSYIPEQGLSVANNYYTIAPESSNLKIWWHHKNTTYNNFYGTQYYSDVTFIFNQEPSVIKTFKTLNYEGTQAKVDANTNTSEGEYYNLTAYTISRHNFSLNLVSEVPYINTVAQTNMFIPSGLSVVDNYNANIDVSLSGIYYIYNLANPNNVTGFQDNLISNLNNDYRATGRSNFVVNATYPGNETSVDLNYNGLVNSATTSIYSAIQQILFVDTGGAGLTYPFNFQPTDSQLEDFQNATAGVGTAADYNNNAVLVVLNGLYNYVPGVDAPDLLINIKGSAMISNDEESDEFNFTITDNN